MPSLHPAVIPAETPLARARSLETLEAAYADWLELRLAQGSARLRWREESLRLEEQGAFLVGAMRAAVGPGSAGPGALAQLDGYVDEAAGRLRAARERLAAEQQEAEAAYERACAELRETLRTRAARYLLQAPPRLRLLPQRVGGGRSVLHLERVGDDDAVLLLRLFTGALPSRYGFLRDDSTEDAALPPPVLYPDEGVREDALRPDAAALAARLREAAEFLPLRGCLPLRVPGPGGSERLFRFLQRGPVLEAEVADGPGFRSLLTRDEAERCTGQLLRLQLQGRLHLEVEVG